MAAALLRGDRGRLSARSAARLARSALPRRAAGGVAGRVPPGLRGRAACGGRGGGRRSPGTVDRARRTLGRDARLHGARGEPVPARASGDVRCVLTVTHARGAALERRTDSRGPMSESDRALQDAVIRALADPPGARQSISSLGDLLEYEQAMMVVEAGPRVWQDAAAAHDAGSGERSLPETVQGTVLLDLAYDLPAVLPKLLQPWTEVPQAAPQRVKLLIARSPHGRVTVARADAAVASVVELADGRKTLPELAREAGLRSDDLEATLAGLADLGAVRFATGS